ncbi:MAG: ABC transporter transmembrane domain-containing protein, partial [Panacagrimonas sp.]
MRGNEWKALGTLVPYLWEYKWRVVFALVCLVAAKLANVGVPLVMKEVVDGLDPSIQAMAVPVALLAIYGVLRFSTTLFQELRDVVFIRVTQRAIRRVALGVFRHLHSLSLRFHLERQTGGMTRDIERGTRGISTLLSYLIFSIFPVILEFSLVAAVLIAKFDWRFAAITFTAVAIYIAFTVAITEWRMEIRRRANELDSRANTRAIDSLLNYETVKYFGNEEFEARRYDENLRKYEDAATRSESSLGLLNIGQSLIIAAAVTALMLLVAEGVVSKQFTLGDLVLVNGLLIQLYIPLNFLGMVYRQVKQSLLDMDRMFRLLSENREVEDRPGAPELAAGPATVSFQEVGFFYEEARQILHEVSFTIAAGQRVAVVGHSGSGKSTMLRLINREETADKGRIFVAGKDIARLSSWRVPYLRRNIGCIFQDYKLLTNKTVYENVAFALEVIGRPRHVVKAQVPAILELVGLDSKTS